MVVVEASQVVRAGPGEVLELVMDLERYRAADRKIRRVRWVEREGDMAVACFWARFRGVPVLATQRMSLTPGKRIEVRNVPSWQDRIVRFEGSFECEPEDGGTLVTHRYRFDFRGPFRLVAEPLVRGWMERDIAEEVSRIAEVLGADHAAGVGET
jgi:hypothetical protein